ncbi:HlyD family type I secretion periplasmic adaptor subunit [Sphingomonas mesophila]|uniref:HlyD family type I secretion periplasmic adaptor subunit n=1 Tax=Sphingomonas mesophila TaxID=2303576 RepID=UPI000E59390B|nr:HlyD family type I secretion periplasmic adaptor subunit [Sphingomonas mesophila]
MASLPLFAQLGGRRGSLSASKQVILWSVGLFVVFLIWASVAKVDEVTAGQGKVIPSSKVQLIQSLEPATVAELFVRSGQQVRRGQVLARLDNPENRSVQVETEALEARAARLGAEGLGTGAGSIGGDEAALSAVRRSALSSRVSALRSSAEQRRREAAEAAATISSLSRSLQLANENVGRLAPLAAKNIVPQTDLATAQREVVDLQGRIAAAREQQGRAMAAVSEANSQASEAQFEFRKQALDERSQVQQKIAVNQQSLQGQGAASKLELRSPVDGVVNDVKVTTIGGFVGAGEKVMEVVPMGDKLLVETRIKPSDIAFIKVGDRALVKVTAYDFSTYGGLDGRVVQVSADSIYDEAERQAYFTVIVETDRSYVASAGRRLPITPGMMTDTQIITGRKSILAYLLKPLSRARSEALRER